MSSKPHEALGPVVDFGAWSSRNLSALTLCVIGRSPVRLWGLDTRERIVRIATRRGIALATGPDAAQADLYVDGRYVFEPGLIDWCAVASGRLVIDDGHPVVVHPAPCDRAACQASLNTGQPLASEVIDRLEQPPSQLAFRELAKNASAFVLQLTSATQQEAHRRSFAAAYRGVSDVVTKYAWPVPAYYLTRALTALRVPPNAVTLVSLASCVTAGVLWLNGRHWAGLACAILFMLLDTVDGKVARCTIASSRVGDLLDHGTDVIAPPLLWTAWSVGAANGWLMPGGLRLALAVTVATYVVQRAIEAAFISRFGFQIHHWKTIDRQFKLVTSQRNTQVPLLMVGLMVSGPGLAMKLLAGWALASTAFHGFRLAMALALQRRGTQARTFVLADNELPITADRADTSA